MRLEELGQGADGQIMALGKLIAAADHRRLFGAHGRRGINARTVFLVPDERAVRGIRAGGDGGAVDLGGAGKNRMVIRKDHPVASQPPEVRRGLRAHEIRSHAIEDQNDDLAFGGAAGRRRGDHCS